MLRSDVSKNGSSSDNWVDILNKKWWYASRQLAAFLSGFCWKLLLALQGGDLRLG